MQHVKHKYLTIMKTRKVLFSISAVGMMLYTLNSTLWHVTIVQANILNFIRSNPPLTRDVYSTL